MTTIEIEVTGNVLVSNSDAITVYDSRKARKWQKQPGEDKKGRAINMEPGKGAITWYVIGKIGATYTIKLNRAKTLNGQSVIRGKIPRSTRISENMAWDMNGRKLIIA